MLWREKGSQGSVKTFWMIGDTLSYPPQPQSKDPGICQPGVDGLGNSD
jgi:hypothetical protein